jgi:8-amino-3,8-dideoxy-alpha-D-manno-octulosonate transaminase
VSSPGVTTDATQLAINGGPPARSRPEVPMFPGGLEVGELEAEAVLSVLRSKRLIRFYGADDPDDPGTSQAEEFERAFAQRVGAEYALAMTSCTASLITGLAALGVGPGDEVIVPAYTFIASASAVLAVGGIPIIAEVDASLTLDPASVREQISPYTKAIMPVHMRGMPADMDAIMDIAAEHGLSVIEDVAQAAGAAYKGRPLGSIGHIGCFSLQMHKIITTGEGGVLVTDDPELLFRAKCFHDSASEWRGAAWQDPDPSIRDSFVAFPGFNFRITEVTAALGRVQLTRLDGLLGRMRDVKHRLESEVAELGRVTLRRNTDPEEAGTQLVFFTEAPAQARTVAAALGAEGVEAKVLYRDDEHDWHVYSWWRDILAKRTWNDQGYPFSMARREIEYSPDMCPRSLDLLSRAVLVNVPPQMTDDDVEETAAALRKVIGALC